MFYALVFRLQLYFGSSPLFLESLKLCVCGSQQLFKLCMWLEDVKKLITRRNGIQLLNTLRFSCKHSSMSIPFTILVLLHSSGWTCSLSELIFPSMSLITALLFSATLCCTIYYYCCCLLSLIGTGTCSSCISSYNETTLPRNFAKIREHSSTQGGGIISTLASFAACTSRSSSFEST